jgi:hypothetical protein
MLEYIYLLLILIIILTVSLIILTSVIIKFKNENTIELYFAFFISGLVIIFVLPLILGIIDILLKNI